MAMDVVRRNPPLPKKIRRVMEMFGDVRVDDYYWLRDDSRCHPDIISYLKEENEYADHIMSGTDRILFFALIFFIIIIILQKYCLFMFYFYFFINPNIQSN